MASAKRQKRLFLYNKSSYDRKIHTHTHIHTQAKIKISSIKYLRVKRYIGFGGSSDSCYIPSTWCSKSQIYPRFILLMCAHFQFGKDFISSTEAEKRLPPTQKTYVLAIPFTSSCYQRICIYEGTVKCLPKMRFQ